MAERIHIAYAKIFRFLLEGPATIGEMARVSGLSYDTVLRFVATLRPKPRVLRICAWQADSMGRMSIQIFELGSEPDAKRPKAKTGAERMKLLKERRARAAACALQSILIQPDIIT